MNWFLKYKLHHIIFWLIYFIFWTYFSMHNYGTSLLSALLGTFIYFLGQAGSGYLSIYYLMPRYLFTRKYKIFAFLEVITITLGAFVIALSMYALFHSLRPHNTSQIDFGIYFFYAGLAAVFFSSLLFVAGGVIKERVQAQKMTSKLEKEKTEHELKFLKSQINPHFLFNAINSIYVLIKKEPELAAATLARFSDMLRYQLYECNFMEVPIEKEIEYLNNYIELEKLRKGEGLAIDYLVNLGASNFLISPLILIPFVENAFKHVSTFSDKGNYINIRLTYLEGIFKLTIRNSVDFEGFRQTGIQIGGIGQDNTRRRLNLIYPGRHKLIIEGDKENYFVSLSIQL